MIRLRVCRSTIRKLFLEQQLLFIRQQNTLSLLDGRPSTIFVEPMTSLQCHVGNGELPQSMMTKAAAQICRWAVIALQRYL